MATGTSTHVYDASTLANFKDWAQFISGAFSSAGWTQTADTGQVNWSTIAAVPGTNAYVYEIWKPADTLQATNPYFVKVEYGNQGGANNPSVRFTIGISTNGAGTITGSAIMGPKNVYTQNPPTGTGALTFDCYWSGDSGRIGIMMWRNGYTSNNNIPMFFGIERTLDNTGVPTSDGVTLLCVGSANSNGCTRQQTLTLSPSVALGIEYHQPITLIPVYFVGVNSNILGTNVAISPVFPCYGKYGNPMTIAGAAGISDVTENTTITTTQYSSTRTYLCTSGGVAFSSFANPPTNTGNNAFLMRYD